MCGKRRRFEVLLLGGIGEGSITWDMAVGGGSVSSATLLKKEVPTDAKSATIFGMSQIFSCWPGIRL